MDKELQHENRRNFLKRASLFAFALPAGVLINCARPALTQPAHIEPQAQTAGRIGGYCEVCEEFYEGMPSQLNWETRIASAAEPGEPLEASGVIYRPDGRTPAPGVILYAYHTDARGLYPPVPGAQKGSARRHGRLRGWVKTNAKGEYKFNTIKPAAYPGRATPAHIHLIVKEADKNEYYIDDVEFEGDPLLTQAERARRRNNGGSGIVRLNGNAGGIQVARRDIILGLNVQNYR